MRHLLFSALAVALIGSPLCAEPMSDPLAGARPPAPDLVLRARAAREMVVGLATRGTLAEGLGLTRAFAAGARRNPFDLDPARVWLIAARDSSAALAAL